MAEGRQTDGGTDTTLIMSHILTRVLFLLYPALPGAAGALLVL